MKTHNLNLILLLCFMLMASCYNVIGICPSCKEDEGIIVSKMAGPEISSCFNPNDRNDTSYFLTAYDSDTLFIRSDSAYAALEKIMLDLLPSCTDFQFHPVDFSQFDVLSIGTHMIGCEFKVCESVFKRTLKKTYECILAVRECGGCSDEYYYRYWWVIPKMPEDYAITFEVEQL